MPQGYGNFSVGDLYEGITDALAGKVFSTEKMQRAIKRTVYELSGTYPMQGLQHTGPFVRFVPGQNAYAPSYFMQPADANLDLRLVSSFFMYYNQNISNPPPLTPIGAANPGVVLKYRSMDSNENTINITTIPAYWGRFNAQIYIAPTPQYSYLCYMRYQFEQTFSNPIQDTDVINFDDDWQDILEFATAMRLAQNTRLNDIKNDIRILLYGDPKAVDAGGERIDLGLIYSRTSQHRRDQGTALRSLKKRSY